MSRTLGIVDLFHEILPLTVREVFVVLTQLGDAWLLVVAVALLYWFGDRREGAFVLAAVLGAFALTLALKGLFALPRPPTEFRVGHADGYGFPSGHAVGATVTWGLLALAVDRATPSRRAAVAAAIVAVVAASRVVIGVHYAVDVLAGIAVGLTYLAALVRATRWNPGRGFAVAAALAFAALAINGLAPDSVATAAGVLGAGAVWTAFALPSRARVGPASAGAGLAALGAVGYAGNAMALPLAGVFGLNLVIPAGILLLPLVVERAKRAGAASPT